MTPTGAGEKFLEELDIQIAGESFNPYKTTFKPGDRLEARISDDAFSRYGGFYVFRTPFADYMPDFEAIKQRNGQIIGLGTMPTLILSDAPSVDFRLDAEMLYFILYKYGSKVDPVGIASGEFAVPYRLTLDEVHLMMLLRSGFKPQDVAGVHAQVVYDGFHMRNSREFLYYGLQVGEVVANISTQSNFGMFYTVRRGNISEDFMAQATSESMAAQIRKMITH